MTFDWSFIYRKKKYDSNTVQQTNLSRVLGFVDITALGISCTLGNGIYVLAGDVIANYAGPSIVLSFLVAGLATFIAGLCYAEFGARVPRSGSAYIYIYVTIGEFVAFVLGWTLILEYVIGVSSGASALSRYIDSLCNNTIEKYFNSTMHMSVPSLAPYPDFLAFGLVVVITALMIVGVKESSFMNKIFTGLNILVIAFIVICGVFKADLKNWEIKADPNMSWIDVHGENKTCGTSERCGKGGFNPFGVSGIMRGAAKCFYAYIGFDAIASTGEEVNNPKRNIPLSIVVTLFVVSICYCSSSIVLTLMIPYYLIDANVPLPQAFDYVHLDWAKYVASAGAIASLATCLYASMFPMPRVVYSLASDGLIFKFLAYVMPTLKTPVAAAFSSGILASILCLFFDLNQLIDMQSIGTLMAYSVVAVCVLILRYRPDEDDANDSDLNASGGGGGGDEPTTRSLLASHSTQPLMKRLFSPRKHCTQATASLVNILSLLAVISIFGLSLTLTLADGVFHYYIIILLVLFSFLTLLFSFIIWKQPQNPNVSTYKIPFVYILPFISVFINLYLMMTLSQFTWIRFAVWFVLGVIVYFSYGIRHSLENKKSNKRERDAINYTSD